LSSNFLERKHKNESENITNFFEGYRKTVEIKHTEINKAKISKLLSYISSRLAEKSLKISHAFKLFDINKVY